MDNRPIGVLDSGLGGLAAVRQLQSELPGEDIVYFGDTGRVPYGTRSRAIIEKYGRQDCRFLLKHGVKCILAACGTVSSAGAAALVDLPVPAIGVVQPAADAAATLSQTGRIGVIGTAATVHTDAYAARIRALRPDAQITTAACPLFVPLVESGWLDGDVTRLTAARYLAAFDGSGIDTLILGCTHYSLLAPVIGRLLPGVTLLDAGQEAAHACAKWLLAHDALAEHPYGHCSFYVSDRPEGFAEVAAMFLGHPVDDAVQIDIEAEE